MIEVLFVREPCRLSEEELAALIETLPPQRREAARRVRSAEERKRRVLVWQLLCLALARRGMDLPPSLAHTERGKPYFADSPLAFSLSHAAAGCAVALSDTGDVGVDIEGIRPYSPRTARFFCSEVQQASLTRLPKSEADSRFTRLWTGKESFVKYTGEGIGRDMRDIPESATASFPLREEDAEDGRAAGWISVAPAVNGKDVIRWTQIAGGELLAFARKALP